MGKRVTWEKIEELERYNFHRMMPQGWKEVDGTVAAPVGMILISNGKLAATGEIETAFLLDYDFWIEELWKAIDYLEEKETLSNALDLAWEEDPEDEAIEKLWDEAYKKEWYAFKDASWVFSFVCGISKPIAWKTIRESRESVLDILKMAI